MRNRLASIGAMIVLFGTGTAVRAQCFQPACRPEPIVLSDAVTGGVPLIWSTADGRLVPATRYGHPVVLGRTIPVGDLIGHRIVPFGPITHEVNYNTPNRYPGALDPGVALMPVSVSRHRAARYARYR